MWQRVTGYTAIIQSQGIGSGVEQIYYVEIRFGGGNTTMDTRDAASFAAWMAILGAPNVEFNVQTNQLRAHG